jgi:hypothetical protein
MVEFARVFDATVLGAIVQNAPLRTIMRSGGSIIVVCSDPKAHEGILSCIVPTAHMHSTHGMEIAAKSSRIGAHLAVLESIFAWLTQLCVRLRSWCIGGAHLTDKCRRCVWTVRS